MSGVLVTLQRCRYLQRCTHKKSTQKSTTKIENLLMEKWHKNWKKLIHQFQWNFKWFAKELPKLVKILIVHKKIHTKITMICENLLIQKWHQNLRKLIHQFQWNLRWFTKNSTQKITNIGENILTEKYRQNWREKNPSPNTVNISMNQQQARKPRSYASSKLCPATDSLTRARCRATSVAKKLQ